MRYGLASPIFPPQQVTLSLPVFGTLTSRLFAFQWNVQLHLHLDITGAAQMLSPDVPSGLFNTQSSHLAMIGF